MDWRYWWLKIVCVVLFIYVFTRGLLTPLKPGIEEISPMRAKSGSSFDLNIKTYNTHLLSGDLRVFIKSKDSLLIESDSNTVHLDRELTAHFFIPKALPEPSKLSQYSIIISSSQDGTFVLPSKLIISQDSIDVQSGKEHWSQLHPEFSKLKEYRFPYRNILYETIRNTFFHVSLWFAMFALLGASVYNSYKYLKTNKISYDLASYSQVRTAVFFGVLGLMTGSLWARFTWGNWWTNDIKLNMAALSMLIYAAYLILRAGIEEIDRKARVSSAFNVFALVAIIPLIFVLPRLTDSLHPGNGGNPAFGADDMDNTLRLVFYPAVIAFTILGFWLANLSYRILILEAKFDHDDNI